MGTWSLWEYTTVYFGIGRRVAPCSELVGALQGSHELGGSLLVLVDLWFRV